MHAKVFVNQIVLFQVVDAYERRSLENMRSFGSLLGRRNKNGDLEITNCYAVAHKERKANLELDLQYAAYMKDLSQTIAPLDSIVGWFCTGLLVPRSAASVHKYYKTQCAEPLLLMVDTRLRGYRLSTRLYCALDIGVPGGTMGMMFSMLPFDVSASKNEMVTINYMQKYSPSCPSAKNKINMLPELVQVVDVIKELEEKVDLLLRNVNDVLNRKRRPENEMGRALHNALTSMPLMDMETFKKLFTGHACDMLLLMTLTELVKAQLVINEKVTYLDDA